MARNFNKFEFFNRYKNHPLKYQLIVKTNLHKSENSIAALNKEIELIEIVVLCITTSSCINWNFFRSTIC